MAKKDTVQNNTQPDKEQQIADRKAKRQERRDVRLGEKITQEAKEFGVDISQQPVTRDPLAKRKQITQEYKAISDPKLAKDIERFASAYQPVQFEKAPQLDPEQLKQSLRKQRKEKVFDIVSGLLTGEKRGKADVIEQRRQQQYQQYKDVTAENQKRAQEWEYQYRRDLLDQIDQKLKDERTSELERYQLDEAKTNLEKAQFELEQARKPQTKKITDPILTEVNKLKADKLRAEINKIKASTVGQNKTPTPLEQAKYDKLLQETSNLKNKQILESMKATNQSYQDELNNVLTDMEDELAAITGWFTDDKKEAVRKKYKPLIDKARTNLANSVKQMRDVLAGRVKPSDVKDEGKYGLRSDGSKKGTGWLGELQLPDGNVATEYSIGVNINNQEMDIPTLVPTLTQEEIDLLVTDIIPNNKDIPDAIANKAIAHAKKRINEGKSPFIEEGETATKQTQPTQQTAGKRTAFDDILDEL